MSLFLANFAYVSYRLLFSAPIVKVLSEKYGYYWAVLIMAQLSFCFDSFLFGAHFGEIVDPSLADLITISTTYTTRVIVAWWAIANIQRLVTNYWVAVMIGAELTFVTDYYIFGTLRV